MQNTDFTTTFQVAQSPETILEAINKVREWWSNHIEGETDVLNGSFRYQDKYLTAEMKITHHSPQRVVWQVVKSHNTFFGEDNATEWDGTQIVFAIQPQSEHTTEVTFTHAGLTPQFECFDVCSNSWTYFIQTSLKSLIETGEGKEISSDDQSYHTQFLVGQRPEEVYNAINNVRAWWSEEIEGKTDELHAEFFYHYKDVHLCKMEVVTLIPNKKVVWFVKDNAFNFVKDQTEWKGTKIVFDIDRSGEQTQLSFTHHGLLPAHECFEVCRDAWTSYIQGSLKKLITTGKGEPNAKEGGLSPELMAQWGLPKK